jgi:hypothetical protein
LEYTKRGKIMARARNIKPAFFKNEILGTLDPYIALLFASLWTLADREGRLEDRPLRIKAESFPYRDLPLFNGYLTALQQHGFIDRYKILDVGIIQILKFKEHQSPHSTEKASVLPANPMIADITVKSPLNNDGLTEQKRPDSLIPDSLIPDSCKPIKYAPPISDALLSAWMEVRKAKRAGKVTELVWKGIEREAGLARITPDQAVQICIERGWQGFKAEWLQGKQQSTSVQDARLTVMNQIHGGLKNANDRQIIDITPVAQNGINEADISKIKLFFR